MTRDDLQERASFWQADLMDVDHLRDVAYEAMESDLDCTEFRLIAGDSRLEPQDARDLLERALRSVGMELPPREKAERIVCESVARSILAGAIEPIWGAALISRYTHDEHPSKVFGPLVADSCSCCNGLDEMVDADKRAKRKAECREDIRRHLREVLPAIRTWAGLADLPASPERSGPGFLGWWRPPALPTGSFRDMERRIDGILLTMWDPIGVAHCPEARDEYDCCAPQVHRILKSRDSDEEVAEQLRKYLRTQQVDHMGVDESEVANQRREVTIQELLVLRMKG